MSLPGPEARPSRSEGYRGNVWRFFVFNGLLYFLLWVPIWVVFLQRKGVSLSQIGLLEAGAWLIAAAVEVPTGAIADRWGRKAAIAMGAGLYSIAMFLVLTEVLSPFFLVGYALWNSSFAFVGGADSAFLYDSLRADGRTSEAAQQSGRYLAVQQASQGAGAVLGAWIATIDITLCFTIAGACGLAATAIALTFKEPPRLEEGETQLGYWRNLRVAIGIASVRPVVRWLLLLGAVLPLVPLVIYYVLLQPYALGVGLPIAWLGVVVLAVQVATVSASWLAHRTEGRVPLPTLVAIGIVLLLVAGAVLGAFPSIPVLAFVLLFALVPATLQPLLATRLNVLIPSTQRATVLSLSGLVTELGLAVTMPTMLALADVLGAPSATGAGAALFGLAVIPLFLLWRSAERR
ncbi:MAG TPA: MFS transporter, partial [Candidatus Limnocylindria bacterium]